MKLRNLIGLAGVGRRENIAAKRWGKRFERGMLLIAIWLPFQWYLELHNLISQKTAHIFSLIVWFAFVLEAVVLTTLVANKRAYLLKNWMNGLIILVGLLMLAGLHPFLSHTTLLLATIRGIQFLILMRLLLPGWDSLIDILSHNRVGTTLVVVCFITVVGGVLVSLVDPHFPTFWDGIWWAWETVSTVGYGDFVPVSLTGRLISIFLMLVGVSMISLLTANFSAYLVKRNAKQTQKEEDELSALLKQVTKQLGDIQQRLNHLENVSSHTPQSQNIDIIK